MWQLLCLSIFHLWSLSSAAGVSQFSDQWCKNDTVCKPPFTYCFHGNNGDRRMGYCHLEKYRPEWLKTTTTISTTTTINPDFQLPAFCTKNEECQSSDDMCVAIPGTVSGLCKNPWDLKKQCSAQNSSCSEHQICDFPPFVDSWSAGKIKLCREKNIQETMFGTLPTLNPARSLQSKSQCPEKRWCQRDKDCGSPLVECHKGSESSPNHWGYCYSFWDFDRSCKTDNDCYRGSQCKVIPYQECPELDHDPMPYTSLLGQTKFCKVEDPNSVRSQVPLNMPRKCGYDIWLNNMKVIFKK